VENKRIAILGASSFVGKYLLSLLNNTCYQVIAFSRSVTNEAVTDKLEWRKLSKQQKLLTKPDEIIPDWICVAPIWILPDYFMQMETAGAKRLVVLSSTSLFTKKDSTDTGEQALAQRFATAEASIQSWAGQVGVEWVILRPTLIYGLAGDKNIFEIARFIKRFGFFPLFGKAEGLRQPVRVEDVAEACLASLESAAATNHAYNISGAQILTYRDMVSKVFLALERTPRLLMIPRWVFSLTVTFFRRLPRYKHWSVAMVERMNKDMAFDYSDATRDFGYKPKIFTLSAKDLAAAYRKSVP
jgi:nucleoside-diphosphate-sugar epimerase